MAPEILKAEGKLWEPDMWSVGAVIRYWVLQIITYFQKQTYLFSCLMCVGGTKFLFQPIFSFKNNRKQSSSSDLLFSSKTMGFC